MLSFISTILIQQAAAATKVTRALYCSGYNTTERRISLLVAPCRERERHAVTVRAITRNRGSCYFCNEKELGREGEARQHREKKGRGNLWGFFLCYERQRWRRRRRRGRKLRRKPRRADRCRPCKVISIMMTIRSIWTCIFWILQHCFYLGITYLSTIWYAHRCKSYLPSLFSIEVWCCCSVVVLDFFTTGTRK